MSSSISRRTFFNFPSHMMNCLGNWIFVWTQCVWWIGEGTVVFKRSPGNLHSSILSSQKQTIKAKHNQFTVQVLFYKKTQKKTSRKQTLAFFSQLHFSLLRPPTMKIGRDPNTRVARLKPEGLSQNGHGKFSDNL